MDSIVPVPKLLRMRVPAYELPTTEAEGERLKLLHFDAKLVEVQPFKAPRPNTSEFMNELVKIAHEEDRNDAECQADLPTDPVIAYLSQETETVEERKMSFSEIREIHESDYRGPKVSLITGVLVMPPPTQKFEGTIDTMEGQYSKLPPRPIPRDVLDRLEETRKLREAESARVTSARLSPRPNFELRSRQATEEITGHMQTISNLQREIEARDREIEVMQEVLDREARDKVAQLTMAGIKAAEDKIKAMEDEMLDDDERTARILARNKELYAEIDLALVQKSPRFTMELDGIPTKEPPSKGQTVRKSGSLRPKVVPHPSSYRRKSPGLTQRISSAFRTAERAIKVAAGTKRLVPAVLQARPATARRGNLRSES